jgi:hypothetical protein
MLAFVHSLSLSSSFSVLVLSDSPSGARFKRLLFFFLSSVHFLETEGEVLARRRGGGEEAGRGREEQEGEKEEEVGKMLEGWVEEWERRSGRGKERMRETERDREREREKEREREREREKEKEVEKERVREIEIEREGGNQRKIKIFNKKRGLNSFVPFQELLTLQPVLITPQQQLLPPHPPPYPYPSTLSSHPIILSPSLF